MGTKYSLRIGFMSNLQCFSCKWSFSANLVTHFHPTPPTHQNPWISFIFVANPYGRFSSKVTSKKSNLHEDFGRFLSWFGQFLWKAHFEAFVGLFKAIWRSYDHSKSSYATDFLGICFGVATGTKQPSNRTFEQFEMFLLWVFTFCHFGHILPPHNPHIHQNAWTSFIFLANSYGTVTSKVTSKKSNLQAEFGSFLFLT